MSGQRVPVVHVPRSTPIVVHGAPQPLPPLDFGPGYRPVLTVKADPTPLPPVDFGPGYTER